jgi:hypothetical protein
MPVTAIPTTVPYRAAVPEFLDNDVRLTPPAGGVTQTLQRLGSRWALSVELAPAKEGTAAFLALQTALLLGRRNGASYPWPQPGLSIGTPGSPVVNGAGQVGTTLAIRSGAASYQVRQGQFFNIISGGRRYLRQATQATTLNGSGAGTLTIWPPLPRPTVDGAAVELAAPVIEGNLTEALSWPHDLDDWVYMAFRIEEVA